MVSKRKPIHSSSTTSVKEIVTLIVLHMCRKSIFFDTNLKVALYLGSLFAVSLLADVFTIPKCYLSKSSNIFNQYFVKLAWGWNLILLIPYVLLTSLIYCCGQKDRILKHHITRLIIATFFWWSWTTFFQFIENRYGRCTIKGEKLKTKQTCLKGGYIWNGFDISGHSFILIYGSLVFIEETKSILNWDSIKEHIRLEEYYRSTKDTSVSPNPLRSLNDGQFKFLRNNYEKLTPYIRALFIIITMFQVLWDVMLISTMLYFHVMVEKLVGGVCAILTWYLTYRFWYVQTNILPKLPGEGLFKYIKVKTANVSATSVGRKRTGSIINENNAVPKYKGTASPKVDNGNVQNAQSELIEMCTNTKSHDVNKKTRSIHTFADSNYNFDSLLLSAAVLHGLHDAGYSKPSQIQLKAIPLGKCGLDLIVKAKSGIEKILVFSLIALEMINVNVNTLQVLIIAPTRENVVEIVDAIKTLAKHIGGLNVGLSFTEDEKNAINCHIAVGTPGDVKHIVEASHLNLSTVKLFVFNEADKLMTASFQSDLKYLYELLPEQKQFLAVSTIMTEELNSFLEQHMNLPTFVYPKAESVVLLGLRQYVTVLETTSDSVQLAKIEELHRLFSQISFTKCLVFSNCQEQIESISNILNQRGWKCMLLTGAQSQVLDKFDKLECKILVTTDLIAPNVDLVINYDVPSDSATYLNHMRRTGSVGICINIVSQGAELFKFQHRLGSIGGNELSAAVIPKGKISEDLWKCDIKTFQQIHGIVDRKKKKANFYLNESEIKTPIENVEAKKRRIHKNVEQVLSVREYNHKSISTMYSGISSDDLLQSLALGKVPVSETQLHSDKMDVEELISPADLYPWIPVDECMLLKPPGLNLLDDSEATSIENRIIANNNECLTTLKTVALRHVSTILRADKWDGSLIEEAINPIQDYLTAAKKEEETLYNKFDKSTKDVDSINLCAHIVDYSKKFSDIFENSSRGENFCRTVYEYIIDGSNDWRNLVEGEYKANREKNLTGMVIKDESQTDFEYCNGNVEEEHDNSPSRDQIFKSYFDYYNQILANTAPTFENVPTFNNWFAQWKSQVKSLTKYVQDKIYLDEMNKYEQRHTHS
ncbi:hypothetical protein FQA39_LY05359 [Lamprigera yunnana]|nr:hypothetical protein FQA39_LY05359 [Lamprigera yunnana]